MNESTQLHHSIHTLTSGLRVVMVPMASVPSVTVLALSNTGSRYELDHQQGIAHFFEHMVFKGTESFPTAQSLASTVDAIGADYNAYTSKEYTGYYVRAASKHVSVALKVVSDMLLHPLLRDEDLQREKGVIVEEINMYADTPMRNIDSIFEDMFYQGSGLGHPIIGTKETVTGMTVEYLRDFVKNWYGLGNLVLVVAGDAQVINKPDFLASLEGFFPNVPGRSHGEAPNRQNLEHSSAISDKTKLVLEFKQTEQAHLMLGWPSIKRSDEKKYAQQVLSIILGGNMSSRLFTEVREQRGLCYYVHSGADYYHDAGAFCVSAGVDPKRIHEALQVILDECGAIADGRKVVTAEELSRAKEYASGTTLLSLEDSSSVAQQWGMRMLLSGDIETPYEALQKIQKVSIEDIVDFAQTIKITEKPRLALIGPYQDSSEFSQYV